MLAKMRDIFAMMREFCYDKGNCVENEGYFVMMSDICYNKGYFAMIWEIWQ